MFKLAIVIPYYKIDFFEYTLESLEKQTNKNFQVYIGNDASPNDPQNIIEFYQDRLQITYKKFEENLGLKSLTSQWDRCLRMIGDESWILILGDDDVLGENIVKTFYEQIEKIEENSNVVRFASRILFTDGSLSQKYTHPNLEMPEKAYLRRYYDKTRSSLSEYIFRRESYEKYGFCNYPLAWHSDDRAWLEFSNAKPIFSINEAEVYFRHSDIHITGKDDNLNKKYMATKEYYKFLSNQRCFSKEHRLLFARNYERTGRKMENLSLTDRLELLRIYIKSFDPSAFKKLLKRMVKDVIKL
jgi:glycosyltransferase involved in cell wall biosynthesis